MNKEESSHKELGSDDEHYEENEENTNQDTHQDRSCTAPDDDKKSDDESYEEDNLFNEDYYEGFAFIQDVACNMNDKVGIPDSWILLDSQSTVDVFMNNKLLKNIHYMNKTLSLHCNTGVTTVDKVRDLPGYGTVWFYEDGIANIPSLNNVNKYRVTYDSTVYDCFEVHKADGTKCVFNPRKKAIILKCEQ